MKREEGGRQFQPNFGTRYLAGAGCAAIGGPEQARRRPQVGGAHAGHQVHQGGDQDDVQGLQAGNYLSIYISIYLSLGH